MIENKIIAAYVQRLAANRERRNNSIKELSYDGDNWAGIYVPETKVMLGGANIDSETFYDDFLITEVDEEDAQDALKYCAGLFVEYDRITMSFKELKGTYEESCRRDELICSF